MSGRKTCSRLKRHETDKPRIFWLEVFARPCKGDKGVAIHFHFRGVQACEQLVKLRLHVRIHVDQDSQARVRDGFSPVMCDAWKVYAPSYRAAQKAFQHAVLTIVRKYSWAKAKEILRNSRIVWVTNAAGDKVNLFPLPWR